MQKPQKPYDGPSSRGGVEGPVNCLLNHELTVNILDVLFVDPGKKNLHRAVEPGERVAEISFHAFNGRVRPGVELADGVEDRLVSRSDLRSVRPIGKGRGIVLHRQSLLLSRRLR